jgi:competence protein ComEC
MAWLWEFLEWLAAFSWAQVFLPAPPPWTLSLAIPGIVILLAPPGIPGRWLGLLCCLPLLFFPRNIPVPGTAQFTLLDVGQGLAAVVRTAGSVLVYDTGPRLGADYDAARAALLPFLRQQGIDRIDLLIISHQDSQHTGGIGSLLEQFSVRRVITPDPVAVPIAGAERCLAGSEWFWDAVTFRILGPAAADRGLAVDDTSCILQIEARGQRLLLAGDIGAAGQTNLIKNYAAIIASNVLVAPDQGNVSALPTFISIVQPDYVLFSTGYKNRYGYPEARIVDNYRHTGAEILNTAEDGAISIQLGGTNVLTPLRYRRLMKRYWHTP